MLIAVIVSVTNGCSTFRPFSIDEAPPTSLSLDAEQRLLLVTDKASVIDCGSKACGADDGLDPCLADGSSNTYTRRVVCAEPSPDALAGLTASGVLDAEVMDQGKATGKLSMAEAIEQISQRTVTVQLLRDALYRACEAWMNGAIGKSEYQQVIHSYDDMVVALLAVEGLTQKLSAIDSTGKAADQDIASNNWAIVRAVRYITISYLRRNMNHSQNHAEKNCRKKVYERKDNDCKSQNVARPQRQGSSE